MSQISAIIDKASIAMKEWKLSIRMEKEIYDLLRAAYAAGMDDYIAEIKRVEVGK